MSTKDLEVSNLETLIEALDTAFELGEECINPDTGAIVSDTEYDNLKNKLKALNPNSYIFNSPTASKVVANVKVKHEPPMASLEKAIGTLTERTNTLDHFFNTVKDKLGWDSSKEDFVQCYKRDGVAISLYYEEGKLVKAGLRPRNGIDGENVIENVKFVEGIPQELFAHQKDGTKLFLPVTCVIRGELECKKSQFRKVVDNWENPDYQLSSIPKNPRNYTAGSIRQFVDPEVTKHRGISFTGYSILNWSSKNPEFNTCPFKNEIERAKYSNAVLKIPFVQVRPFRFQDLSNLEKIASSLDYEVDGAVISVNSLEDQEQLGNHGDTATGNPRGKIAWKFSEQSVEVEVKNIEWTPGRSGKLTPVIYFDPVQIDGTTVRQCTAHNLGFVDGTSPSSLGEIKRFSKVKIIKSGKIIPKIIGVTNTNYTHYKSTCLIPHNCPSCNSKLIIEETNDGKNLICNSEFCGVRAVARLVHYLQTIGVKGISEAIVTRLVDEELVQYFNDFYSVSVSMLKSIGYSKRNSLLIVSRIKMHQNPTSCSDEELEDYINKTESYPVQGDLLFAAMGIAGAGKSVGQLLINHFGSFEAIRCADLEQLLEVEGIGQTTAEAIIKFFVEYESTVDEILEFINPIKKKEGKLSGKNFVFSGTFPEGKNKWQEEVKNLGGSISSSVSKNTSYLVIGTDAGSKLEKAKELNITTIDLEALKLML